MKNINTLYDTNNPEAIWETINRKGELVSTFVEGVSKKEVYFYVNRDYTFHYFKDVLMKITFSDV